MESLPHLLWPEGLCTTCTAILPHEVVRKRGCKKKREEGDGTQGTQVVNMPVSADTRYIISTSGRPSSMRRYKVLLRDILKLNISYIPINAGGEESSSKKIDPQDFVLHYEV